VKILIFEYITGGGFCTVDLPAALACEGELMRNALLADFAELSGHEIFVMVDSRCVSAFDFPSRKVILVNQNDDVCTVFDKALNECDAVWIIAPETENILFDFSQRVEIAGKRLLSNPSSAVAKTADKLQTFQILEKNNIPTIPTQRLSDLTSFNNLEVLAHVIKPIDGVGCENSFFIQNQTEFKQIFSQITETQNYIIQPFIKGDALSVSAIFKHGQAQLLCVNRQIIQIENQQFQLIACEVNIAIEQDKFQKILTEIAQAFPDLFGYVGIDLILADLLYVVEINPRLTSSYAGIKQALGINLAKLVLQSVDEMPLINPPLNQTILVEITHAEI
jgi:predicted ATP-grasp superfamily ATP-dependent carboligase